MSLNEIIAHWVYDTKIEDIPQNVLIKAKECIVDVCGVTLAARHLKVAEFFNNFAAKKSVEKDCSIIGYKYKADAALAGLANGVMAHALDLDDTNYSSITHPSAIIFPTVLACGEKTDSSGLDVLTSFIIGYEVECKLGAALNPNLYQKGWFSTSLLGTLGSALAAAKLLGLNKKQIKQAIGLSVCQTAGIRRNNGTMAKPYAVGKAVENGIMSAMLVQEGITASEEIFGGTDGFINVYNGGIYDFEVINSLGKHYELIKPGPALKQFPACSGAQSATQAVLDIMSESNFNLSEIESILCEVTPLIKMSLKYGFPETMEQAQFSMPFCVASALVFKRLDASVINSDLICNETLKNVMGLVKMEVSDEIFEMAKKDNAPEATRVTIELKNSIAITKYICNSRGTNENPFTKQQLEDKFINNAKGVISMDKIENIIDIIWKFDAVKKIKALADNLVP